MKYLVDLKPKFSVQDIPKICVNRLESLKYIYSKKYSLVYQPNNFNSNSTSTYYIKRTNIKFNDNHEANTNLKLIATQRGKLLEPKVISFINNNENKSFAKYRLKKISDFGLFKIAGYIDGIDPSRDEIIEVKTRKFFDTTMCEIDKREKIKLFCYMKLFDARACYFVQLGPNGYCKIHIVDWEEKFWNKEIYSKLVKFTNDLNEIA